tara:strand:- start:132 stop:569 length:438 start_codon:yes stop_codon:yes gene_type:complete
MKSCKQCNELKPLDDYYAVARVIDGRSGKCKECIKAYAIENRNNNLEYYRKYDRLRGNRQPSEYLKAYRDQNPAKYKAHSAVSNALRAGKIKKAGACEICSDSVSRIHGHHDDYLHPLEVRWLCAGCHRQWHVKNGEALNARAEI